MGLVPWLDHRGRGRQALSVCGFDFCWGLVVEASARWICLRCSHDEPNAGSYARSLESQCLGRDEFWCPRSPRSHTNYADYCFPAPAIRQCCLDDLNPGLEKPVAGAGTGHAVNGLLYLPH